jgi:N,N-dimethylformamidase
MRMSERDEPMPIVGYADHLSAVPGDRVAFKVSAQAARYSASLVRLIHGDVNPAGPGFKEERIPSAIDGEYSGRRQRYPRGSYVEVPDAAGRLALDSFTVQAWILPTAPGPAPQGLVTRWSDEEGGYGLFLDAAGALELRIDGESLSTGAGLRRDWYFVAATLDAATGRTTLHQRPLRPTPDDPSEVAVVGQLAAASGGPSAVLLAAHWGRDGDDRVPVGHYNGRIDRPRLFREALSDAALDALEQDADPELTGNGTLVAAWHLGAPVDSDVIPSLAGGLAGRVVNMPTRQVTAHDWSGAETEPIKAPAEFTAIHFHDDDLADAVWDTDFTFDVPPDLKSGVYAAHLQAGEDEDYVPFVVRPPRGRATARIAVVLPTFTYLAYGNEHITWRSIGSPPPYEGIEDNLQAQDHHAVEHQLLSLYDSHRDGTGVCYSSRLRPIVNMRPKYAMALLKSPHLFNADLHLTDWLEHKGYDFDVLTDEDLHHEGLPLIESYAAVLTGSHPEYTSGPMLDALEAYLGGGGNLMYLGANGFYWVTTVDPVRPHLVEVRRGHIGTATWRADPGEEFHTSTGERGGLWRFRGRAPNRLGGIGYTATGYAPDMPPYRRTPDSFDPRAAFLFVGVGEDEPIGDGGLVLDGAAGFEMDRADFALGTPAHALVVAKATGYSDHYQALSEEILVSDSRQGGTVNPLVRADMVYYETPSGGGVFAAGAISWCGSLSHGDYDNSVSRITENALRRFLGLEGKDH